MKHYKLDKLTIDQKREIITRAIANSTTWWADILDCQISFRRIKILCTFDEIMKLFNAHCFFGVFERDDGPKHKYLEVGFRTMNVVPDYFLFIHVPLDKVNLVLGESCGRTPTL